MDVCCECSLPMVTAGLESAPPGILQRFLQIALQVVITSRWIHPIQARDGNATGDLPGMFSALKFGEIMLWDVGLATDKTSRIVFLHYFIYSNYFYFGGI